MRFHLFKERKFEILAGLLFMMMGVGCGETFVAPVETAKDVHADLSNTMKATFANLVKESKSQNAKALLGSISNLSNMFVPNMSAALPAEVDMEFITRMVEDLFASEVAKELFAEANVSSRTATQVTYEVKPSVCPKLTELMPSNDDSIPVTCTNFLQAHALEIRVNSLPNNAMQLELWHTERSKMENLQRVLSLAMSPNLLGLTLNLDGAQKFIDTIMTFGNDAPGLLSLGIKKLSGEATLQLKFKSENMTSGCKHAEDFCLLANVDRALELELDMGKGFSLKLEPSWLDNPTFMLSANSEAAFLAAVNLGALEGKYGPDSVFLEAMQFKLSLPQMIEGLGFQVFIDKFSAGPRASELNVFGKKLIVDFASDLRAIEKLAFAMEGEYATLNMSPLAIKVSMVDEANASCLMTESIQLASDPNTNTSVKFAMPSGSLPMGPGSSKSASCNESNLFIFGLWSIFGVSSEDCDQTGLLNVEEGLLELTYNYLLNGAAGQPMSLRAEMGQCIRM